MDSSELDRAVSVLKKGGVLVFPTETVYGIGCDAFNSKAITRVISIKKRTERKPLPVLISDIDQLNDIVSEVTDQARDLANKFWPGPLTIVFGALATLPDEVTASTGTVGVRMPAHPVCLEIIKDFGGPLVAPSANFSGEPPPTTFSDISPELIKGADMALDDGVCRYGVPSTVADATGPVVKLIREGAILKRELQAAINAVIE